MKDLCDRMILWLALALISIAGGIGRKKRPIGDSGCHIMVTGRFDSPNWIRAHLVPLAKSEECSRLWMVSTNPVPPMPKVEAIYPPQWLRKCIGATPSRLLVFLCAAVRRRPHIVGGFHLIYNGIAAAVAGRLVGARSMYVCVGGTEVENEGIEGRDNCFMKTQAADPILRRRRLQIVSTFDLIITMGSRAAAFFRNRNMKAGIYVVSGGIDAERFCPADEVPCWDIIFVARFSPEKRIDVFLQAVRLVADKMPNIKVAIVGEGVLRDGLQRLTDELGIRHSVDFVGYTQDVEQWLRRSRVFVLTSDLEGLPLSAMEAMMCGVPAVVSRVGDLADLVEDGVNGYLVPRRAPEVFAERIVTLLSDEDTRREFSEAAHRSALRYELQAAAKQWDRILAGVRTR